MLSRRLLSASENGYGRGQGRKAKRIEEHEVRPLKDANHKYGCEKKINKKCRLVEFGEGRIDSMLRVLQLILGLGTETSGGKRELQSMPYKVQPLP